MNFGLQEFELNCIVDAIKKFNEVEKTVIFGSRAKGNYKPGSDIDIAIYGDDITFHTLSALTWILEEQVSLPYFFDVIDYTHIKHKELKEHIDRVGKVIYEKN